MNHLDEKLVGVTDPLVRVSSAEISDICQIYVGGMLILLKAHIQKRELRELGTKSKVLKLNCDISKVVKKT